MSARGQIEIRCTQCGRSYTASRAIAVAGLLRDDCPHCGGEDLRAIDPVTGNQMNSGDWPDDPDYPSTDWYYEVKNGDTGLGYEEWLEHKYDAEDADPLAYHDAPDAPLCEVDDCPAPAEPCPCGAAHCPNHPHVDSLIAPGSNKGRAVPKTCPRCGAASTGGRYCPRGCGPI